MTRLEFRPRWQHTATVWAILVLVFSPKSGRCMLKPQSLTEVQKPWERLVLSGTTPLQSEVNEWWVAWMQEAYAPLLQHWETTTKKTPQKHQQVQRPRPISTRPTGVSRERPLRLLPSGVAAAQGDADAVEPSVRWIRLGVKPWSLLPDVSKMACQTPRSCFVGVCTHPGHALLVSAQEQWLFCRGNRL